MSNPYIGEIRMFAGSFAPAGWAMCQGQLMPISENDALFTLIGTTYGGDGQSTFGLPDLQGRVPIHQGQGGGLSGRILGERSGSESVTLLSHLLGLYGVTLPKYLAVLDAPSPSVKTAVERLRLLCKPFG